MGEHATCRLNRPRFELFKNLAFAASKRTAKTEKLTNVERKDFLVSLGGNLQRFGSRGARIANLGKPSSFLESEATTGRFLYAFVQNPDKKLFEGQKTSARFGFVQQTVFG
ncbi:MAG: hypothetical protein IJW97_02105, partial [Clostridia bacterium]|nr:hypothetical protein [Clostridia bacterium]